ncbi:MAG: YggU family protein [Betaproteobacteria bacterium]|nr:MAG: YggU family protein [Betaproteobacteria bacterium]
MPSSSDEDAPWRRVGADGSVTLTIHAQPGAKKTEVAGVHGDALKIRVASPPDEGRANEELRRFLADAFGVPRRNVTLVRGDTGRRKTVRIASPTARPDLEWTMADER